tara:strand:+ start:233 stop:1114 length:882 start_codon:yes stop_codon:yes gene_type:complete
MTGVKTSLGILGGSGIYQIPGVEVVSEHSIVTPFGQPSDKVVETRIADRTVYFLPRHGKHHQFLPSEVPYQANIFAMKTLGVTHLLAVSAVGIMQENIRPGQMVVPDQIFDRTKGIRQSTFFGNGIVGHLEFASPFSQEMRQLILTAAAAKTGQVHDGGAYVCMEGPQFSTRSESNFYRETLKPAVIGMTAIPEAKLAREAEMCYGMLALATDFDCWHENEDDVSVEAVLQVLKENADMAGKIIIELAQNMPSESSSPDLDAAKFAIITKPAGIPEARKRELEPLFGKYLGTV